MVAGNGWWKRAAARPMAVVLSVIGVVACPGQGQALLAQDRWAPPPPLVTDPAWRVWLDELVARRLAEAPRERSVSYHFAASGDDVSGDGTAARPWRSLAKAQAVLDADADGDVAILLRRGDVWRGPTGLVVSRRNVTIADYGEATAAKPLMSTFVPVGDPAAWQRRLGTVNTFMRPMPFVVTWVKEDEDRSRPYSRQMVPISPNAGGPNGFSHEASLAAVEANEGSWYFDRAGMMLYVHPRHGPNGLATDPRTDGKAYMATRLTGPGILVWADGARVENIVTEGWGMDDPRDCVGGRPGSDCPTQANGIDLRVRNQDRAVVVGGESYYGDSHVLAHYVGGAGGGIATFVNCVAGLTSFNANAGETIFNTYAQNGGSETLFIGCTAKYGTLPSADWDWGAERRGAAFYGHATSAPLRLAVVDRGRSEPGPMGPGRPANIADLPEAGDLASVRGFIVDEWFRGERPGVELAVGPPGVARVGGRYLALTPAPGSSSLANWAQRGWLINSIVEIDCSQYRGQFALFNAPANTPSSLRLIGNDIRVTTRPGVFFQLDFDTGAGQSVAGRAANNILVKQGGGEAVVNFGGPPGSVTCNALVGFTLTRSFDAHVLAAANLVLPAVNFAQGEAPPCDSPLVRAADITPAGIALGVDAGGPVGIRSTIGPVEAVGCFTACGPADVTGVGGPPSAADGLLTGDDFVAFVSAFAAGGALADLTGIGGLPALPDGLLTGDDFVAFVSSFAGGCP